MAEPDFSIQPAAHEDAKADARSAAKWLIAAFAAVGAVLVSGIGLSSIGDLGGWDLVVAVAACVIGVGSVIAAVTLIGDVLTPDPITLKGLARRQERLHKQEDGKGEDQLIEYLESDPSFLQGIADDASPERRLVVVCEQYEKDLRARYYATEEVWKNVQKDGADSHSTKQAEVKFDIADTRVDMIHFTVRRLERIAAAQNIVLKLRSRRRLLSCLAAAIALSIGAFAFVSSSSNSQADFRGAVLERVNLSGANLRAANFGGLTIRHSNFRGTDLEGANLHHSIWLGTICPDGTNSDKNGHNCAGHLSPRKPKQLP